MIPLYNMHIFVLNCKVLCCLRYVDKAVMFISVFRNESKPLYVIFPYVKCLTS